MSPPRTLPEDADVPGKLSHDESDARWVEGQRAYLTKRGYGDFSAPGLARTLTKARGRWVLDYALDEVSYRFKRAPSHAPLVDAVRSLVTGPFDDIQSSAVQTMLRWYPQRSRDLLRQCMSDPRVRAKWMIAHALAKRATTVDAQMLIHWLKRSIKQRRRRTVDPGLSGTDVSDICVSLDELASRPTEVDEFFAWLRTDAKPLLGQEVQASLQRRVRPFRPRRFKHELLIIRHRSRDLTLSERASRTVASALPQWFLSLVDTDERDWRWRLRRLLPHATLVVVLASPLRPIPAAVRKAVVGSRTILIVDLNGEDWRGLPFGRWNQRMAVEDKRIETLVRQAARAILHNQP